MPDVPLIGPVTAPELHVMTFNIRRRMMHLTRRSPDRWHNRKALVRRILRSEQPTVLGIQEAMPDQMTYLAESLPESYLPIGYGRNPDMSGERCAIFYDRDRLQLGEWSQLALSDTPEVPGSRTWGNMIPRVVISARFTDKVTGIEFLVLNTHFDHLSRKSRFQSARMLRQMVAAANCPVVVMGDANTSVGTVPYRELIADGTLRDSWVVAAKRLTERWTTFSHYKAPREGGRRIDWLLVSPDIDVKSVGINAVRFDGRAASDHEPVQAVLRLRNPHDVNRLPG